MQISQSHVLQDSPDDEGIRFSGLAFLTEKYEPAKKTAYSFFVI